MVVSAAHRGRQTGRALLRAAESLALDAGVEAVGVSVKAGNAVARSLYLAEGFAESEVYLEKRLARSDAPAAPTDPTV